MSLPESCPVGGSGNFQGEFFELNRIFKIAEVEYSNRSVSAVGTDGDAAVGGDSSACLFEVVLFEALAADSGIKDAVTVT